MRFLFVQGVALAVVGLCACGSDKNTGGGTDASSADDPALKGADDGGEVDSGRLGDADSGSLGDTDSASAADVDADATTNDAAEAGDAGDSGHSCASMVQADAGAGACPTSGQVLLYPCGLPVAVQDLDGGATGDGGWTADGGHAFACMTLCNDIPVCYVTPGTAPAVLVSCCP